MIKILVLSALLYQEVYEISGQKPSKPSVNILITPKANNISNKEAALKQSISQMIYDTHQEFNFSGPLSWLCPSPCNECNNRKELRSDYKLTKGIGAHKVHARKVPWNTARQICVNEGGHLAVFKTLDEQEAVRTLMLKHSVHYAWVGLHDIFKEGDWISVLDEPFAKIEYNAWSTIHPSPDNWQGKENCAAYMIKYFGLNDDMCHHSLSFVCKINTNGC